MHNHFALISKLKLHINCRYASKSSRTDIYLPTYVNIALQRRLVLALLIEHALWFLPATIFLSYSITNLELQTTTIIPHLILVFSFALAFTALRTISTEKFNPLLVVAHASALAILLTFYIACIVGHLYWGRFPTTQMLSPYIKHSGEFLNTLNIPITFVLFSVVFFLLLCYTATKLAHNRSSIIVTTTRSLSYPTRATIFLTGIYLAFTAGYNISILRYHEDMEPLTFVFGNGTMSRHVAWSPRVQTDAIALTARNSYFPSNLSSARNIVLIVGDALRPSRMSLFGAQRKTTPELEQLANSLPNTHIDKITTSCAESFCGLISLSRSRYAYDVSKNDLTISDVLSKHGYQTNFILGGDHTNFYGLRDWFGKADSYWDGLQSETYANDDRAVINQLKTLPVAGSSPLYLQIHLMSTHALGQREDFSKRWTPTHNYYTTPGFVTGDQKRTFAVRNYYDNGVVQFDKNIRYIIDTLDEKGYLKDALVIITGDHGEMLGEHNLYSHANGVYQPALEVPLLLFRFGHSGPVYENNSSAAQIDIGPTILSELNLPIPDRWIGNALNELQNRRFIYFEHKNEFGLIDFSLPNKKWKYWLNRKTGAEFAFELNSDPGETRNRITSVPPGLRAIWRDQLEPSVASLPLR